MTAASFASRVDVLRHPFSPDARSRVEMAIGAEAPFGSEAGMTPHPLARRSVAAAAALVVVLLTAPSAVAGNSRGSLAGPTNLRVAVVTPHSVTLAWDAASNSGSFTYVIEAGFGYRVGV